MKWTYSGKASCFRAPSADLREKPFWSLGQNPAPRNHCIHILPPWIYHFPAPGRFRKWNCTAKPLPYHRKQLPDIPPAHRQNPEIPEYPSHVHPGAWPVQHKARHFLYLRCSTARSCHFPGLPCGSLQCGCPGQSPCPPCLYGFRFTVRLTAFPSHLMVMSLLLHLNYCRIPHTSSRNSHR